MFEEIKTYGLESLVNVCVFDNNIDKENVEALKRKTISYNFEYHHNIDNIGSDRNIFQCYKLTRSSYVWVVGDDDYLLPGELHYIVNCLMKVNPDLIILRPCGYDVDYINEVPTLRRNYTLEKQPSKFIYEAGSLPTFISSMIVKSQYATSISYEELIGSNLIQIGVYINALKSGSLFLKMNHYSLSCKRNNTSGYDSEEVFVIKLFNLLEKLNGGPNFRPYIIKSLIIKLYPQQFLLRRLVVNFDSDKKENIKRCLSSNTLLYYTFLHPIITFPKPLAIIYGFISVAISRLLNGDFRRVLVFMYTKTKLVIEKII